MRKMLLLLIISCGFISCKKNLRETAKPIEKYKNQQFVVVGVEAQTHWNGDYNVQIKNSDTIIWVRIVEYDVNTLTIGDTL